MAQPNGNGIASIPSESVQVNGDAIVPKQVKPRLSIKVAQPIELKNHVHEGYDSFDTLHSQMGDKVDPVSKNLFFK